MKKHIILIGFMGSGKTSAGIALSYRMKRRMTDTDRWIEEKEKKTISQIFAESGEEAFRQMETNCLKEMLEITEGQIISVGGGLPVREENHILLKQLGTVFYLKATPDVIYDRLKEDTTRPLLQGDSPEEKIERLLAGREPVYESCADHIIDVSEKTPDEIAAEIEKKWKGKQMKILVMNGPNINFLGIREKHIYGNRDYDALLALIAEKGKKCGCSLEVFQSNHEGALIDRIQDAYFDGTEGIVINPGAYTHYSYAIHDALASITIPKVEIHISDITNREEFRKVSVTAPACDKQIYGHGLDGYLEAIDYIIDMKS